MTLNVNGINTPDKTEILSDVKTHASTTFKTLTYQRLTFQM